MPTSYQAMSSNAEAMRRQCAARAQRLRGAVKLIRRLCAVGASLVGYRFPCAWIFLRSLVDSFPLLSVRQRRMLSFVRFIETSFFTRRLVGMFSDEQYKLLQNTLSARPEQGALIPGSGGLRKVRWALPGRGKSGGCRLIYYWKPDEDLLYLLLVYSKAEKDNLSKSEIRDLRFLVKEEFR